MARSGNSRAEENRAIRREALREQLANQGHLQHVVDITEKLANLDNNLDTLEVQRLKAAADIKLKLIAKYVPDVKAIEITGEDGESIKADIRHTLEFVSGKRADS